MACFPIADWYVLRGDCIINGKNETSSDGKKLHTSTGTFWKKVHLVVIRKRNNWRTNTKYQWRMNLTMRVCLRIRLIWVLSRIYKVLKFISLASAGESEYRRKRAELLIKCQGCSARRISMRADTRISEHVQSDTHAYLTYIYGHGNHGSLLFFSIYVLYISFWD